MDKAYGWTTAIDPATGKTRELLTPEQLLKGAEEHLSPEEKARRSVVIAKIGSVDELHKILEGWPEAMREEGNQGTHWLGQRLMAAGVAVGPTGDPVSDS